MDWSTKPDRESYLRDRIEHYDQQLSDQILPNFILDIITEERFKCKHELSKLREIDIAAMYMANASVCPLLSTKSI